MSVADIGHMMVDPVWFVRKCSSPFAVDTMSEQISKDETQSASLQRIRKCPSRKRPWLPL